MIENIVPAKIPIPPKEGVMTECELRSPGISYRRFLRATEMMAGMAKNVNENAVTNDRMMSYIKCAVKAQI